MSDNIQKLSQEEMWEVWHKFAQEKGIEQNEIFSMLDEIQEMVAFLYQTCRERDPGKFKSSIEEGAMLRKNPAFRKYGIGYLLALIPRHRWEWAFHLNFKFKAMDAKKVKFKFGRVLNQEFYQDLHYIQALLDHSSYEMREEALQEAIPVPENPVAAISSPKKALYESLYR